MKSLIANGYTPIRFCDVSEDIDYPAIIRHDVDMDLQEAVNLAKIEKEEGIRATYFVLLTSDYYNLLAGDNLKSSKELLELGHEIGLHFDISAYDTNLSVAEAGKAIKKELEWLEQILEIKVKSISWHIPRKDLLGAHLDCLDELGVFNAYDPYFYLGYKYISDSMMRWREPVEEYIQKKEYNKLQILTHPIWYRDVQDKRDEEILNENRGKKLNRIGRYLDTIKPGYYSIKTSAESGRNGK